MVQALYLYSKAVLTTSGKDRTNNNNNNKKHSHACVYTHTHKHIGKQFYTLQHTHSDMQYSNNV